MLEYAPVLLILMRLVLTARKTLFVSGCVLTVALNTALKNIIREPRPAPAPKYPSWQKFGMPSGHAQMAAFSLLFDVTGGGMAATSGMAFIALMTSLHRLRERHHTMRQVAAGWAIGALTAAAFNQTIAPKK